MKINQSNPQDTKEDNLYFGGAEKYHSLTNRLLPPDNEKQNLAGI